jgi:hypothetical protein
VIFGAETTLRNEACVRWQKTRKSPTKVLFKFWSATMFELSRARHNLLRAEAKLCGAVRCLQNHDAAASLLSDMRFACLKGYSSLTSYSASSALLSLALAM